MQQFSIIRHSVVTYRTQRSALPPCIQKNILVESENFMLPCLAVDTRHFRLVGSRVLCLRCGRRTIFVFRRDEGDLIRQD